MPIWRPKHQAANTDNSQMRDAPCTQNGCLRTDVVSCEYQDSLQHRCPTALCPDHRVEVNGQSFCRRHANTVIALGKNFSSHKPRPALNNRSASLVKWVGDALDTEIRELLSKYLDPGRHEQIVRDDVRWGRDSNKAKRWSLSWKLFSNTGTRLSVVVESFEQPLSTVAPEIRIRAVDKTVATATPPWIAKRLSGQYLSPEEDSISRKEFYTSLVDAIAASLEGYAQQNNFGLREDFPKNSKST